MCRNKRSLLSFFFTIVVVLLSMASVAFAGEADIKLPDLTTVVFTVSGTTLNGITIMNLGLLICAVGVGFGWMQYIQTKNLPAHKSMLDVSDIIWETCKSYLAQQGKFLVVLWILIAICMIYYFVGLQGTPHRQQSS